MPESQPTPDISVRGGIVNVPPSTTRPLPPRHQPDTPTNKKFAPHTTAPKKRRSKQKTQTPDTPPQPPGENTHVPAETS